MKYLKVLLSVLALSIFLAAHSAHAEKLRALFGDGSVRYASVGMIGLNSNQNALIGLLLPAVQKARATVKIVDQNGDTLFSDIVSVPDNYTKDFFSINFTVATSSQGVITLSDGTTQKTIGSLSSSSQISVLIGLLLPAVQKVRDAANRQHVGSVQIVDKRSGDINFILPFIEQAVISKSVALGR